MKTHQNRGYIHREHRSVLLWHRSLQCWILSRIQKNGKLQDSLYGFRSSRAEAITAIRKEYGKRIPQQGWEMISVKHKGLKTWNQLVHLAWAQNQKG